VDDGIDVCDGRRRRRRRRRRGHLLYYLCDIFVVESR